MKNPGLCQTLPALLATGRVVVDHALVPIRVLEDAARSRVRIGGTDGAVPGGLRGTSDPAAQSGVLAEGFHNLMQTLAAHDIPHTLLDFPRFALDAEYAWTSCASWHRQPGAGSLARPSGRPLRLELIHRYGGPSRERDGEAAERFIREERQKRLRRRARRVAAGLAIIAGAILAARYRFRAVGGGCGGATPAPLAAPDGRPYDLASPPPCPGARASTARTAPKTSSTVVRRTQ